METKIMSDGHIHTPFCPHGSKDPFEAYVEEGIRIGRKQMTFTEHFPLPEGIADQHFIRECSLLPEEVPAYLAAVEAVKKQYSGKMNILKGFEIDYVEGKEEELKDCLGKFGKEIEDSILSVHFVLYEGAYYAIDCLGPFESLLSKIQDLSMLYDLYYQTVLKSIEADLGPYKPKRIGHPTLIRVFNQKYPLDYEDKGLFETLLMAMKKQGMSMDFNSAGLRKPYCKETYPSGRLLALAREKKVSLVPGSDAHEIGHMAVLDQILQDKQ